MINARVNHEVVPGLGKGGSRSGARSKEACVGMAQVYGYSNRSE